MEWNSATPCRKKKNPPLLPRGLTPSSLAWQAHDSMTMCAKFQQRLHSTGPTGPDSLELPTALSASPRGHLARSHRCRVCAAEVSMWTDSLTPAWAAEVSPHCTPSFPSVSLVTSAHSSCSCQRKHGECSGKASLYIPARPLCRHDLTSLSLNNQVCRDPSLRAICRQAPP